jgi:hypothetical protein
MRNYIFTIGQQCTLTYDDGAGGGGQFLLTQFGSDVDDCKSRLDSVLQYTIEHDFLPGVYTFSFNFTEPIKAYWLFDKESVITMINGINPEIWWDEAILGTQGAHFGGPNSGYVIRSQFTKSPRQTWRPDRSIKQKKQDFSGAAGLVEAFLALEAYVTALRQSGRKRDAGIVQFAIDQVNKNIWSITEAFDYLRKQRLL